MFKQPALEQIRNFNLSVAIAFGRGAGLGYVVPHPFSTNACKAQNPDPVICFCLVERLDCCVGRLSYTVDNTLLTTPYSSPLTTCLNHQCMYQISVISV